MIDFEHGEGADGERAQKESSLEDSTERSESNPGRSLGIITSSKKELSGRQYPIDVLARLWLSRHIQNQSRIADATDLFFHGFLLSCWISLRLSGAMIITDYLLLEVIQRRKGANTIRSKSNTK